jgi:hypothetical protein
MGWDYRGGGKVRTELIVILCGVGAVALLWLALRFGRHIARALLVGGILAVVVVVALALLSQAGAARQAAQAATVAATGQAAVSVVSAFCMGGLSAVVVAALSTAGLFWLRWARLRWLVGQNEAFIAQLKRQRLRRRALPHSETTPEVSYIVEDEGDPLPIGELDLSFWGW